MLNGYSFVEYHPQTGAVNAVGKVLSQVGGIGKGEVFLLEFAKTEKAPGYRRLRHAAALDNYAFFRTGAELSAFLSPPKAPEPAANEPPSRPEALPAAEVIAAASSKEGADSATAASPAEAK